MRRIYTWLLSAFAFTLISPSLTKAQLVSGDVFMQGSYVEVGIAPNGAFGSKGNAPSGYHPRTEYGAGAFFTGIGFVADPAKDGWTVGSPAYYGDYFLPGTPQEGWDVEFDGTRYEAWRELGGGATIGGLTGKNISYTSASGVITGVWQGAAGNMAITQTTYLRTDKLYFVVSVNLTNTGTTTMHNVYYDRTVDPDNEETLSGDYSTDNKIVYNLPSSGNKTLVTATGPSYPNAYLGLGSKDCRAKPYIIYGYIEPVAPLSHLYADTGAAWQYTYAKDTTVSGDVGIGIVFKIDSLLPGASTSLAYAYILKQEDLDSAFADIAPVWSYNGTVYASGDTIKACAGSTINLSIINGGYYDSWTWSPTTGVGSPSAATSAITVGSSPVTYKATGYSTLCSSTIDRYITILPQSTPDTPVTTTPVKYCIGAAATALSATKSAAADTLIWYTAASGGTGSSTTPVPNTTTIGTVTYYVSTRNSTGCESARVPINVNINALPAVPTAASPVSYCMGAAAVALSATTASTSDTLYWYNSASGGTGSTTALVPNTGSVGATVYYVSARNIAGCESARLPVTVTINALPAAPAVSSPLSYCEGATPLVLSATGIGLLWYTSPTGGSGSTTAPTPATSPAGSTIYYVSQTAGTCEGPRAAITVNINALPTAPVVTTPLNLCKGSSATALTAIGAGLQWYTALSGGSGSTAAPVPATTVAGSTTYYVSQTIGACESDRSAIVVNINDAPLPVVVSPVKLCQGSPATALTATGTALKWYTTPGGTGTSVAPVPATTTAGSTTYYVTQTVAPFGCESDKLPVVVTVNAKPVAKIKLYTPGFPGDTCFVTGALLQAFAIPAVANYQWYSSGTALGGAVQDTLTPATGGYYSVVLSDANGCSDSAFVLVRASSAFNPTLSPTDVNICPDVSIMLYCSPAISGYTYLWQKDGSTYLPLGTTTATAISTPGVYQVRVTDLIGCVKNTNAVTVNRYPDVPKPTIIRYDPVLLLDNTYSSYAWYRNYKPIAAANAQKYTLSFDGTYYARVTDENGCVNYSDTVVIKNLGVATINNEQQIAIYPNPSSGQVYISAPFAVDVAVIDVAGRSLLQVPQTNIVNMGNLPDGVYLITCRSREGELLYKTTLIKSAAAPH